ncbi:sensor histidine kinase [Nitrincola alkalisediminis]|uniref:sensor histidine kinase n=1 Tax=Nitrincola alkalisediminis TaxID=1366656 RepID=UPI0018755C08|nr:histidine kinase [Nitrincola alkalisediminis]
MTHQHPEYSSSVKLNSVKVVIRVIVFAQAVAILLALAPGLSEDRWYRLGLSTLFIQWVALLSLAILHFLSKTLHKQTLHTQCSIALSVLLINTTVVSGFAYWVLILIQWQSETSWFAFTLQNLLIGIVVGMIGIEFFVMHTERNQYIQAQSQAELNALQARIRPHFLFNSLNTVAELTRQDPESAETALLNLSSLFRAAMHAAEATHLDEEIRLVKAYLNLEQWRLGDRLRVEWQLPDNIPNVSMPLLTLQPLVENAVRHGIETSAEGGCVLIKVCALEQTLQLTVENPIFQHARSASGNGIALENIQKRLALFYSEQSTLTTVRHDDTYQAILTLPLSVENSHENANSR